MDDSVPGFSIEMKKFALEGLLERAFNVIPSTNTDPVLKNFKIVASPGKLTITASDSGNSVIATTSMVMTNREGTAYFPAKRLLTTIKAADDGDVTIDVTDDTAVIKVGNTKWNMNLQKGSSFPQMPNMSDIELSIIDRASFLNAIKSVRYAAGTDAIQPALMLLNIEKGKITACDGTRFQQATLEEDFPSLDIQIPIQSVPNLIKLLTVDRKEVLIGEGFEDDREFIVFRIGFDYFIINKLVTNKFDMEGYLLRPALTNTDELLVERQEMIEAIKRVRINADPDTSAVVLSIRGNTLIIEAHDKSGNKAQEILDVQWKKKDRRLAVNHKRLTQMLESYNGKICYFYLGEDLKSRKSPIVLKSTDDGTIGVVQQSNVKW